MQSVAGSGLQMSRERDARCARPKEWWASRHKLHPDGGMSERWVIGECFRHLGWRLPRPQRQPVQRLRTLRKMNSASATMTTMMRMVHNM